MLLGENLSKIMNERNLSVPELSKFSGVPIRTIEDLKKRDDCKVSTIKKIAAALDVGVDELIK